MFPLKFQYQEWCSRTEAFFAHKPLPGQESFYR